MSDHPIARTITNKIITALEGGVIPWSRPWSSNTNEGAPISFTHHWRFTGINQLMMNIQAEALGFRSRWWASELTWHKMGGRLKKKPEGVLVSSWGTAVRPHGYYYFNIDQIQGGKGLNRFRFTFPHKPQKPVYDNLVALIDASGARVKLGGDRAVYKYPPQDLILCPEPDRFEKLSEFYTTLLHEVAHREMHLSGMDRGYAGNELVVQLTACYVAAEMGVPIENDIDRHASYLNMWLRDMKKYPAYIVLASRGAMQISRRLVRKWHQSKRKAV